MLRIPILRRSRAGSPQFADPRRRLEFWSRGRPRRAWPFHRLPGRVLALTLTAACLAGCSGSAGEVTPTQPPPPPPPPPVLPDLALGKKVFDEATFGGNGRTCVTCHMPETGTVTIEAVAARLAGPPGDALFLHDALDNGLAGTSRLAAHATIRVELDLPPYVTLVNDPTRRTIVVNRGIPSTINTPALDGGSFAAFMYDLRNNDLKEQALGAIRGHAKSTAEPTAKELEALAFFEEQDSRFFSSAALRANAAGGARPELPAGSTDSERRGRLFFLETGVAGTTQGMCGQCHGGANLNQITLLGNAAGATGLAIGSKFANVLVSETNANNDPMYIFRVDNGSGDVRQVISPDPGIMLTERKNSRHLSNFVASNVHPATLVGMFKTPSLWGVKNTPPYFHNNSAKTLRDVVDHYADRLFKQFQFGGVFVNLTEQDREDIVAFLKLL
jgi:cytochrome c peroxidase